MELTDIKASLLSDINHRINYLRKMVAGKVDEPKFINNEDECEIFEFLVTAEDTYGKENVYPIYHRINLNFGIGVDISYTCVFNTIDQEPDHTNHTDMIVMTIIFLSQLLTGLQQLDKVNAEE